MWQTFIIVNLVANYTSKLPYICYRTTRFLHHWDPQHCFVTKFDYVLRNLEFVPKPTVTMQYFWNHHCTGGGNRHTGLDVSCRARLSSY